MNRIEISAANNEKNITKTIGLLLLGQIATIGLLYYGAINLIVS